MSLGYQKLNLVHISDVCSAFHKLFELLCKQKSNLHQKFAVSTNDNHTIREVVSIFEAITQKKLNINWGVRNYRSREVMELWKDGDRLPNWTAKISLKDGLQRVLKNV